MVILPFSFERHDGLFAVLELIKSDPFVNSSDGEVNTSLVTCVPVEAYYFVPDRDFHVKVFL